MTMIRRSVRHVEQTPSMLVRSVAKCLLHFISSLRKRSEHAYDCVCIYIYIYLFVCVIIEGCDGEIEEERRCLLRCVWCYRETSNVCIGLYKL